MEVSEGAVRRDFTYIDDIVQGIVDSARLNVKYDIFNLGNHDTAELSRFIKAIEVSSGITMLHIAILLVYHVLSIFESHV